MVMDPVSAFGVAASIVQLLQFSAIIISRLDECLSSISGLPASFKHVQAQLELLLVGLNRTHDAINDGAVDERAVPPLRRAIKNCKEEIQALDEILKKTIPKAGASGLRRKLKALESLRYDGDVARISQTITGYITPLTFEAVSKKYDSPRGVYVFVHLSLQQLIDFCLFLDRIRPDPSSTVPMRPDPQFVDRTVLMAQIEDKCRQPAARVALVGIGGVG
jgi:hypothetical protein